MDSMIGNFIAFLLSSLIGTTILYYGYYLFSQNEIVERVSNVKPTLGLYIKEYFFYEIFLFIALFMAFYVEGITHIIIYLGIVLTGLSFYILDFKSFFNKNDSGLVEIGYIDFKEKLDFSFLRKEKKGLLFLALGILLGGVLYFDPTLNKETYYVGLSSPILTPILYWIAYTDRTKKLILERFLILSLLAGLLTIGIFYTYLIENTVALMVFSGFSLFCIGLINQFRKDPVLGYMDFPVAFTIGMMMFGYSFIFFGILLGYTWIQGIVNKFGVNDKNFAVGLFGFSHIAYILSLLVIWLMAR